MGHLGMRSVEIPLDVLGRRDGISPRGRGHRDARRYITPRGDSEGWRLCPVSQGHVMHVGRDEGHQQALQLWVMASVPAPTTQAVGRNFGEGVPHA